MLFTLSYDDKRFFSLAHIKRRCQITHHSVLYRALKWYIRFFSYGCTVLIAGDTDKSNRWRHRKERTSSLGTQYLQVLPLIYVPTKHISNQV